MTLKITFELEEKDLSWFRDAMKRARAHAATRSEDEIIKAARETIEQARSSGAPEFVRQRVDRLAKLIEMLGDEEWKLQSKERANVVAAIAYFADPQDLIPDNVPVIGYIDDAIMIEMVVRELQHEIDAFEDFCKFRADEAARNRNPSVSRAEWLAAKRLQLHSRMRRRRMASGLAYNRGGRRTRFRLF